MAKVVVIMSVYHSDNSEYLLEAINSILSQTYYCDLYIYKDGELSDELNATLQAFYSNERITFFGCSKNNGLAHALNHLIKQALRSNYDYIARMDSDDISFSERVERQVAFLDAHSEVDVLGTACSEFGASFALKYKKLPHEHEDLKTFSITRCPFIHPTVVFRANVFEGGNLYPTDTNLTEDMALWFILLSKNYRFANLDEVLLQYRLNEATVERRKGLLKAFHEVSLRLKYMYILKQVTLKNFVLIISRLFFHCAPNKLLKFAYKKLR
tara:strand:- start:6333 stop:7142 length:810 start_codon:yes stop_codon:yes gene_type:complete